MTKTLTNINTNEYSDLCIYVLRYVDSLQHLELLLANQHGAILVVTISIDNEETDYDKKYFIFNFKTLDNYSVSLHNDYLNSIYKSLDEYLANKTKESD